MNERIRKLQGQIEPTTERATDDRIVRGYATVWDTIDREGDRVRRGAFRDAVKSVKKGEKTIVALWQHQDGMLPIGKIVELQEDETGLRFAIEVTPRSSLGDDFLASVDHGTIEGVSFAGTLQKAAVQKDARDLLSIDLDEISPCLGFRAANPAAAIAKLDHYGASTAIELIASARYTIERLSSLLSGAVESYESPIGDDLESAIKREGEALRDWIASKFSELGAKDNG